MVQLAGNPLATTKVLPARRFFVKSDRQTDRQFGRHTGPSLSTCTIPESRAHIHLQVSPFNDSSTRRSDVREAAAQRQVGASTGWRQHVPQHLGPLNIRILQLISRHLPLDLRLDHNPHRPNMRSPSSPKYEIRRHHLVRVRVRSPHLHPNPHLPNMRSAGTTTQPSGPHSASGSPGLGRRAAILVGSRRGVAPG